MPAFPLYLMLVLLGAACARSVCDTAAAPSSSPRVAPDLRRAVSEDPDSVIGVLLRTTRPVTAEDRAALERCGLVVGSVVGDIVTGEVRAGDAARVAALPFVAYMEAARVIPVPPPVLQPDTAGAGPATL
jgi:hypothetical protein